MSRIDDVLRQIYDLEQQIAELPDDDFVTRIELRDQVLELRSEVGKLRVGADAESPTDHLLAQLTELRRQRKQLRKQRIDVVKQGVETRIYPEVEAGLGISDVEGQIKRIEEILVARGVDPD